MAAPMRLKKMAAFARGRTLDVGFARLPNPYLEGDVVGLDVEPAPRPGNYSAVVVGDVTRPCFAPASFDTIVAGEFIEHLETPLQFLRDCRCLIRQGGTLVLSTPNPYYPPIILLNWLMIRRYYYSPYHLFEIAPRYMVRFLEQTGFASTRMVSGGTVLPLGRGRSMAIPLPRAICYQMIYVAQAV